MYIYTQKTDIGIDTDVDIKKIRAQSSIRKSNHNTMNWTFYVIWIQWVHNRWILWAIKYMNTYIAKPTENFIIQCLQQCLWLNICCMHKYKIEHCKRWKVHTLIHTSVFKVLFSTSIHDMIIGWHLLENTNLWVQMTQGIYFLVIHVLLIWINYATYNKL